ncbi:MAG: hypothetical protein PHO37_13085 [Kiritimatiellae bacterium]|nr:hypothetical protein [Kiritimatiellia bacterium]
MARKLQVEYPGAIYHITHRGNGKMKIFSDDHDRERFLLRRAESLDTYNAELKIQLEEITEKLELLREEK